MRRTTAIAAAAALLLGGCSSRPREFAPVLAAAPADQARYDADVQDCMALLSQGKLNSEGRLASGAAGVAAGATTAVLGGAAASSAGLYTGMAVASATVVALPIVAIAGAIGMAKIKRGKKERAIQAAMSGCLAERGHSVAAWEKVKRKPKTPPAG